ncbi:MAG: PorT family protein [bacterium]|nr:PorT family protein [bacterium]
MNRLFLFLIVFYSMITISYADNAGSIKIMGGISYDKMNLDVGDSEAKLNFIGGLGIEVGRGNFRFDSNLLFSKEKRKFSLLTSTFNMYSLSLPVMVKCKLAKYNAPYVVAGFQGALIMADRIDEENVFEDGKADILLDYGAILGGGIEFDVSGASILVEGRLHIGLKELELQTAKFKTNSIMLLIGIRFW